MSVAEQVFPVVLVPAVLAAAPLGVRELQTKVMPVVVPAETLLPVVAAVQAKQVTQEAQDTEVTVYPRRLQEQQPLEPVAAGEALI